MEIKKPEQEVNAVELGSQVETAWQDWIQTTSRAKSSGTPYVQANVWAGQYSPCSRQMYNRMLHGGELPDWTPEQLARFRRGRDRESDLLADLREIGRNAHPPFEITGEQERFELIDRKQRKVITGKVDAKIRFKGHRAGYPLEVKAWSPYTIQGVECFEDLFQNKWSRRGAYQILCYLYGAAEPLGFMLLDRPGLPLLLPVELFKNGNEQRVDEFLDKASEALDGIASGIPPDFTTDLNECKSCDFFGSHCMPPMLAGEGAKVIVNDVVEAALDRIWELKGYAKEFDRLDKEAKKLLRGVEFGLCGNWLIEGKYQSNTVVKFPDEETKKKFQITDPKGKFMLKFYRVGTKESADE